MQYFYTQIKYKRIAVYIENMTGEELKSWYQKELFTLNMLQMKTNKERYNKRRKLFKLCSHNRIFKLLIHNRLILFYRVYLRFILDLRIETTANITKHILNYNSSFLLDIINYNSSFLLDITNR